MAPEKEQNEQANNDKSLTEERKIHHTHFPVVKKPQRKTGYESTNEWVPAGIGKQKLVPKKKEK